MSTQAQHWSLVCHLSAGGQGYVAVISRNGDGFTSARLSSAEASGAAEGRQPLFLGLDAEHRHVVMSGQDTTIANPKQMPADAFPIYSYRDPSSGYVWFVSDGDKDGNDALNCGATGSPIIICKRTGQGSAELVKLICMGRGHHVVTYTGPDRENPDVPSRAFVSNLLDGSISVVSNDPDAADYLQVIETINLCEPEKEEGRQMGIPNNAFPHGQVYASRTGKVYSFNNGYGTVAVIDPTSCMIEGRIEMKVSSNLLLSPDQRFLIGKGADRKSDADHVLGRLTVIDIDQEKVVTKLDLPDVYPSVYRFSLDGSRLYVTTAATGKGDQRDNLNRDTLLVYDATALPELKLLREVKVGVADCGRRPIAFDNDAQFVFVPNPTDASVSILDAADDRVLATVSIGEQAADEINFSFWAGDIYGA